MAHALKIVNLFNTSSLCFCVIRDTHNKNPLKKFNCWGSPWHAAEHYTAAHSAPSPVGWGRKIRRAKVEKRMGWDEDSLVSKMGKKTHKSTMAKSNQLPSADQYPASLQATATPRKLPSPFLFMIMTLYGICLWSVWVSCPNCVPSQPLTCSQHTCWWEEREKQKKPWHCAHIV